MKGVMIFWISIFIAPDQRIIPIYNRLKIICLLIYQFQKSIDIELDIIMIHRTTQKF